MPLGFPRPAVALGLVGRTPWSAADAPVGLLAPCKMPISLFGRDEGFSRGPGGACIGGTGFSLSTPACGRIFSDLLRRSEEHTSELQSLRHLVCRLLLEKKY